MQAIRIDISDGQGRGFRDALSLTEITGRAGGLRGRELLQLRLLAEEMLGLVRSISGGADAQYWLEQEGGSFELHLATAFPMTDASRRRLKSLSAGSGTGFMTRLSGWIAGALSGSVRQPDGFFWTADTESGAPGEDLERSIVKSIADEVRASVRGSTAEVVIRKTFRIPGEKA